MLKYDASETKLHGLLNKLFDLASNDLILTDRDSGLNDYEPTLKFADRLDSLSEVLIGLSKDCVEKATAIRTTVEGLKEKKINMQEVLEIGTVTNLADACPLIKERAELKIPLEDWITDETQLLKREPLFYISESESDDDETGNMDIKFKFAKYNNNEKDYHQCAECGKKFRDQQMLRNHLSNHITEIYRCMKCMNIFRSERSFANHSATHNNPKTFRCTEPSCGAVFNMKTSLQNHMQKHSDPMECNKCGRTYQYRQGYLEHITYRHLEAKSIPCPGCNKLFWTPTQMRSHRTRYHGPASDMYQDG